MMLSKQDLDQISRLLDTKFVSERAQTRTIIEQETRRIVWEETPGIVEQETRRIILEETPGIVETQTRSIIQTETPRIVREEARMIIKEELALNNIVLGTLMKVEVATAKKDLADAMKLGFQSVVQVLNKHGERLDRLEANAPQKPSHN